MGEREGCDVGLKQAHRGTVALRPSCAVCVEVGVCVSPQCEGHRVQCV